MPGLINVSSPILPILTLKLVAKLAMSVDDLKQSQELSNLCPDFAGKGMPWPLPPVRGIASAV